MNQRFVQEARQDRERDEATKAWFQERIAAIHGTVTVFDVLRRNGVRLKQVSDNEREQISCPFHGADNRPSAKVFPADTNSPSHVWCYVCHERWDAIGLWKKFEGLESFSQALAAIEREFGLKVPERPAGIVAQKTDTQLEEFEKLLDMSESRLVMARSDYERHNDMAGYLSAGSVLDRVRYRVRNRVLPPDKGVVVLTRLLDRIGEKIRT